jgi:hypothetical protein
MRRPIGETYLLLSKRLGEPTELSLRKQFCLQYLKWGFSTESDDKELFVDLAKLWRKEAGRVGSHRTLLERKARKLFRQVRKHKNLGRSREGARQHGLMQKEQGIGIHDPALAAERKQRSLHALKIRAEKNAHPNMKDWIVHHVPTGQSFKITNLRKFCRDNDLDMRNMWRTVRDPKAICKGWRAERYSDEWDNL